MGFDFELSGELALLQRTTRAFAQQQLEPAIRTAEANRRVDAQVRAAFDAIGLGELELGQELGGHGLGALARVVVNEELGAGDPGAALALDRAGPAFYVLSALGDAEAQALARTLIDTPSARSACAWVEQLDLTEGRITAAVPWVAADQVDLCVLLAPRGAVLVREGIELTPLPGAGLRAAGASALQLRGAPVLARLDEGRGYAQALSRGRLYVASLLLGVLRQTSDYAQRYAQERTAFGRPIAHHQALAFALVEMHAAVEMCRLLIHEAAFLLDQGDGSATTACAAAFVETIEASRSIGPLGVQVLGGHGFMQDHPVEKYNREARALSLLLGGVDTAREQAASALAHTTPPVALSAREP